MHKLKYRLNIILLLMLTTLHAIPVSAQSLIRDTEIETTLREWGTPIFKAAELNPEAVKIILIQNNAINAFVAGGSNIFFYTGLLEKTDGPGEVIGVLAHETGHITGGHLIRTRDALERASYESIIGTILGIGAAVLSGDSGAAVAVSSGSTTLAQRRFLAHSRIQESSADQAALTFFEKAKLNPTGLSTFMDKLKAETLIPESQQSEYIRTHPLVDNRVEALQARIQESPYTGTALSKKWQEQHARMKAKLIGFIHPNQIPWVYDDNDKSVAADYARAIAAYRENKVEEAIKRIDDLIEREPKNPYFHELKGQMLLDFSRVSDAAFAYAQALQILPNAPLIQIAYAHALIESAKNDEPKYLNEAIKNLESALRQEPRTSRAHRFLATAYGRLGQESAAKIHLAEEAVLQRRISYAREHANAVLAQENEGSLLWLKAKDILSFIETMKKG